jgi:hypothetical protein
MHGFINLLVTAGLLYARRADATVATDVLSETDPASFALDEDGIAWRDHHVTTNELVTARAGLLRSFGSCSFEEPIDELRRLGWWPQQKHKTQS